MRVLVLGGYGLIGSHVVTRLLARGHDVAGLGRDIERPARQFPEVQWIAADLSRLLTAGDWLPVLEKARPDAIVNAAGLLQDGAGDRIADVQAVAMQALYEAAAANRGMRFVQISATRASPDAATAFMRTKGLADGAVARTRLQWTILRPGLVFAPIAYGGTALVRALAAFPWVMPVAYADRLVQTVSAEDVAEAVLCVLEGRVAGRRTYDLVEETPHTLLEMQREVRRWLGFAPVPEVAVPSWLVALVARIADGLGWLGWRSPFRSTAVAELAAGIRGDPLPWREARGYSLKPLPATLRTLPSTIQERWFARAFLVKPLAIATLSAFWIASGALVLAEPSAAKAILTTRGVGESFASAIAIGGACVDVALGLAVLAKASMARAALGMVLVTLAYLVGGSLMAPDLWLDPLGPFVKAVPATVLAVVLLALEGDR